MSTQVDLDRVGGRRGLDSVVSEVLRAGELALEIQRSAVAKVAKKVDRSPVTEADKRVEEQLRGFLEKRFPEASFLGEETGKSDRDSAMRWVLDPIDGTRAFIRNLDGWSVLLGLELDGEPAVGIAYLPAKGQLFVGARGHGAYMNGRPIQLSEVSSIEDALVLHGGLAQFTDHDCGGILAELGRRTYTQRCYSDFENYALMLQGHADAMVEMGIHPYDVAPAAVLVREAGGRFTDMAGKETIHSHHVVASNGRIHDALLELVTPPQ